MQRSENICLLHWLIIYEFFAIAAVKNKVVMIADNTNAYQQSPPPAKPCFLVIDMAYQSWYQKKFNEHIDPEKFVIPLSRALQGHPKAGALWEMMIVGILKLSFSFKSTMHEWNIYSGVLKNEVVYLCHQILQLFQTQLLWVNILSLKLINESLSVRELGPNKMESMFYKFVITLSCIVSLILIKSFSHMVGVSQVAPNQRTLILFPYLLILSPIFKILLVLLRTPKNTFRLKKGKV